MEQVAALFGKKLDEEFRIRKNCYISCSTVKARFMDKGFQILYDGCDYWTYNPERLSELITGEAVIVDEKTDDFTE